MLLDVSKSSSVVFCSSSGASSGGRTTPSLITLIRNVSRFIAIYVIYNREPSIRSIRSTTRGHATPSPALSASRFCRSVALCILILRADCTDERHSVDVLFSIRHPRTEIYRGSGKFPISITSTFSKA
jgi:hypothetical protein